MANANGHKIYHFDDFRLDAETLMLDKGGSEIALPPKVVKTLAVLLENQGEIVNKTELIDAVWGELCVEEANLSQHLYLLRKSLGSRPDGGPYIETLRRRGYRFAGRARVSDYSGFQNGNGSGLGQEPDLLPNRVTLSDLPLIEDFSAGITSFQGFEAKRAKYSPMSLAIIALPVLIISAILGLYWFQGRDGGGSIESQGVYNLVRLTNGLAPIEGTISPDGKYFVYHETDGKIFRMWLQQTGQPTRLEIIPASARPLLYKTFSPDGQFVFYLALDELLPFYSLYRVPTLGGPVVKLVENVSSYVSFSPDGREMVFYRYDPSQNISAYLVKRSDGSGPERILYAREDGRPMMSNPAWSPDGKTIVVGDRVFEDKAQGHCTLLSLPATGGAAAQVSDEQWLSCWRIVWHPDGRGFYMIGTKESDERAIRRDVLYYVSYPGGRSFRLSNDESRNQGYSLGVTNDGSIFTVPFNRSSQIWAMDSNGDPRTLVQLTSGLADGRAGIAPIAEDRVAFTSRNGDSLNLWAMNEDGSDQRPLVTEPFYMEEVRSGGGGSSVVFSAKHGRYQHLFRAEADGSGTRQLTFGESFEVDSTVSGDGKWVAYSSHTFPGGQERLDMYKLSLDGGELVNLNRSDCSRPHFSPDDAFLSCVTHDDKQILILSSADGSLIRSLTAIPGAPLNFGAKWTPDGSALVYPDSFGGKASNLWIQPVDGSPGRQITTFNNGTIYHLAYSLDGSRLFVARGQQIRDAVLLSRTE